MEKVTTILKADEIVFDEAIQSRVAVDESVVAEYAEAMENGTIFPSVTVFYDVGQEKHFLAEGFHRFLAHKRARPNDPVQVEVKLGTRHDALWHSIASNRVHGLRRSHADKIKAAELALLHDNGRSMSNRQIAEHVGVTPKTVAKVRKRLEQEGRLEKALFRKGADGRTISTAGIGKKTVAKDGDSDEKATAARKPSKISRIRRISKGYVDVPLSRNNVRLAAVEIRDFFGETYAAALGRALLGLVAESDE